MVVPRHGTDGRRTASQWSCVAQMLDWEASLTEEGRVCVEEPDTEPADAPSDHDFSSRYKPPSDHAG